MPAVEVTITYLEMDHPAMLRPKRAARAGVAVDRVAPPVEQAVSRLYRNVGTAYHWTDRSLWTDDQWREYLAPPGTELWMLRVDGNDAGFFLLMAPSPTVREIQYLGLLPGFDGQGLGAHLLTCAVDRAWESGADHVVVNTCTLDHPAALPNYLARGFEVARTRTEWRELPQRVL